MECDEVCGSLRGQELGQRACAGDRAPYLDKLRLGLLGGILYQTRSRWFDSGVKEDLAILVGHEAPWITGKFYFAGARSREVKTRKRRVFRMVKQCPSGTVHRA